MERHRLNIKTGHGVDAYSYANARCAYLQKAKTVAKWSLEFEVILSFPNFALSSIFL